MAERPSMFQLIEQTSGFPELAVRFLLCLLTAYPFAFTYRLAIRQRRPWIQHLFSTSCGLGVCYFVFGLECLHSLLNIVMMYCLLHFGGPTRQTVALSLILNMGYLWLGFYYRIVDEFMIDWSVPHCILCLRLMGLAWDYYDGNNINNNEVSEDMKTTMIHQPPSLLEMLGYSYFFGSFLVGPQFPIRKYLSMVEGNLIDKDISERTCVPEGLRRLFLGLFYGVSFAILSPFFGAQHFLTPWFEEISFFRRMWFITWFGKVLWFKYLALFLVSEGSCIIAGLGYNGKDPDGNPQWDGVANMKIISYETSLSVLEIIQSFHLQTSLWLVRYVYKRLKFLGNRFLSLGLSQTFLAVWHGYMIGYYLLFVLQFFYVVFEKTFISTWQRFGGLPVYDMPFLAQVPLVPLLYVVKQMMTSYGCVPLALLHWHKIQRVFTLTYYAPVVLVCAWDLVLYPLVFYPAVRSKSRTNVKKWS
ncbi:lysophospholipid acyltransferase 5-like [Nematostella vectensis]|uniref:lysophospholipid acyltransferase 5-like n=1 Tax=Nematostella vectensis TaxID=45351 RepID=UPI00207771A6|nr:lysophospholipid acyltransferase 5-like [Nematostella vectensis]